MAILFILLMVLVIINTVLLGILVKGLQKVFREQHAVDLNNVQISHRLDCLDNQGHLFLKKLEDLDQIMKHCDTFMGVEQAKSKAMSSWLEEMRADHKAIAQGIEDRYEMIYEEFKAIREAIEMKGELAKRIKKAKDLEISRQEKVTKAKQLKEAGKSNKDIAKELGVAESTVRIYLKEPGLISPDEEDPLGMPQIDDPAAYHKYVDRIVDEKLNTEAVDGKSITYCPFSATHGECDVACSDACHDCIESARAFNLQD